MVYSIFPSSPRSKFENSEATSSSPRNAMTDTKGNQTTLPQVDEQEEPAVTMVSSSTPADDASSPCSRALKRGAVAAGADDADNRDSSEDSTETTSKRSKLDPSLLTGLAEETPEAVVTPTSSSKTKKNDDENDNDNHGSDNVAGTDGGEKSGKSKMSSSATAEEAEEEEELEIVDLAENLGFKAGDRLEVQWEIHKDGESSPELVWWKATLLEHDGRSTDEQAVAIRSLLYDARPDLGYPEPSQEDVVFAGSSVLLSPDDETVQLQYKREGLTEFENEQFPLKNEEDVDDHLNSVVMNVMEKHKHFFAKLPAAQQATIAEKLNSMKEEMKTRLQSLEGGTLVTSDLVQELLQQLH